jgi:hypothetical protein
MTDKARTVEIIEALANGVHPATGEVLPENSPYQDLEVTRALFRALDALKNTTGKKPPPLQGSKWTPEEEEQLRNLFDQGWKVPELAKKHQRTAGAIRSRLKKMGLIKE